MVFVVGLHLKENYTFTFHTDKIVTFVDIYKFYCHPTDDLFLAFSQKYL